MRQETPVIGSRGEAGAGRGWRLAGPVIDVCCVLAFVAIGRASHHDGETAGGLASTAWPFLAGLGAGLLVTRAWRRPEAIVPAGLGAWLGAVVVGMALRVVAGQGTAPAFIVVALCFLGLFLLGWRSIVAVLARRRAALPRFGGPA
jgi:peptidoglycan/LPS O-acetylase OafA/YrhL